MAKSDDEKRPSRIGCLLILVVGAALLVVVGLYLGQREDAAKTPCQRYAKVYTRQLDNCHSGVTKSHAHHIEICEREVDPSDACIRTIEAMTCDQLEAGPARVAPQVCGKHR